MTNPHEDPNQSFPAPLPIPASAPGPRGPLSEASPEQRRQALAMAVGAEVARGARVESQTENNAVVVFGSKPNHTLHLLLSVFTCGFWLIVWAIVAVAQKESRVMITVDPYGQVLRQQMS